MKNKIIKSLFVLVTLFLISCNCNVKEGNNVELISVEKLGQTDNTIQLIDVRTPQEFEDGYIEGAININVQDSNFLTLMSNLDKEKPVYVYCKSGKRSGFASSKLSEAGFKKVYDLEGGIVKWKSEGKKTTKK